MTTTKRSTARKGDPGAATRGAAVRRAKIALSDAIRLKLSYDEERAELDYLAGVLGCDRDTARARLEFASLDELTAWSASVGGAKGEG